MPAITTPTAKTTGTFLVAHGTITADTKAWSSTATWNNAGVTFTHIFANVTNTASNAASKLIDLQTGGVTQFNVTRAGVVTAATSFVATTLTGTLSTAAQPNVTSVGTLTSLSVSGTANPQLTVTSSNAAGFELKLDSTAGTARGALVSFYQGGVVKGYVGTQGALLGSTSATTVMWAVASEGLAFHTNGNATARMTIASGGDVAMTGALTVGTGLTVSAGTTAVQALTATLATVTSGSNNPLTVDFSGAAAAQIGLIVGKRGTTTRWFIGTNASDEFAVQNAAGNQNNLVITDAGAGTFRAGLTIAGALSGVTTLTASGNVTFSGYGSGGGLVSVGAADSGGAGFKLLRVPN